MIRIGVLGAARITPRALVYPMVDEPGAFIYGIAARDRSRAEGFAQHHSIPHVYDSYDEVIDNDMVDAIYNPLPISAHHEWSIKALEAGKHVLCEKPMALNLRQAQSVFEAARKHKRFFMEVMGVWWLIL